MKSLLVRSSEVNVSYVYRSDLVIDYEMFAAWKQMIFHRHSKISKHFILFGRESSTELTIK
jgi:hypothetical protein